MVRGAEVGAIAVPGIIPNKLKLHIRVVAGAIEKRSGNPDVTSWSTVDVTPIGLRNNSCFVGGVQDPQGCVAVRTIAQKACADRCDSGAGIGHHGKSCLIAIGKTDVVTGSNFIFITVVSQGHGWRGVAGKGRLEDCNVIRVPLETAREGTGLHYEISWPDDNCGRSLRLAGDGYRLGIGRKSSRGDNLQPGYANASNAASCIPCGNSNS